jgi:membrane protease YdiL (CAAX protease family)
VTKSNVSLKPFWAFLLLTYGITWAFWIPAALLGQDVMRFPTLLLHTLGGFGPSLAGIFMIYRARNPADRRDFWRRVVDFHQIGIGWLALILVIFPLLALVSIAIARLAGGPPHLYTNLARLTAQPLTILFLLPAGLISGPIPEELGWRGFALDRLQARMRPLAASVTLGLSWSTLAPSVILGLRNDPGRPGQQHPRLLAIPAKPHRALSFVCLGLQSDRRQHSFCHLDASQL